jgi:hypothetical protein
MTDDALYLLVQSIVVLVTGLPGESVIPGDDNQPAPSGPYAAIKVGANRSPRGQANISKTNVGPVESPIGNVFDVEHEIKAQLKVDVSINFYRGGSIENAALLIEANKRPDVSAALFQSSVGWGGASAINDLTALQSKEREERSQITLTLMYEGSQKVETNAIYSVPVSVENENSDTLETTEINAPVEP